MKLFLKTGLIATGIPVAVAATVPLLIPIPPLEGTVAPEKLTDPDSKFISLRGVQVHYKMAGAEPSNDKPTLVLLHGLASSTFSWREVMQPLSDETGGSVIAYDRTGFGLTSRPMPGEWIGASPYGHEAQIDLLIGLLDAFQIQRAILVGNSAGGTIAALTALHHPERVQALILVDPAIYITGSNPSRLLNLAFQTPQMRRIGMLLARQFAERGKGLGELAWHDPSKITPEIWAGYLKPGQADNWDRALWEFVAASRPMRLRTRLDEIRAPTLVISGDDDRIVPTTYSIRLARELPNAELVVIPNSGHLPQEETPDAFMQAVKDFLAKLPK